MLKLQNVNIDGILCTATKVLRVAALVGKFYEKYVAFSEGLPAAGCRTWR
jgi:hypothetical protein